MQDKTKSYPQGTRKLNVSHVSGLSSQNEKFSVVESININHKQTSAYRTNNIRKKSSKEEEKNFKQKLNYGEQLGIFNQEEGDESCSSDSETIENTTEGSSVKSGQRIIESKLLKPFRSLSSSVIEENRRKVEYINETENVSKSSIKNHETSNKNKINPSKNHRKSARGILFLNKKRKFLLNCLFGKNEVYKNMEKPRKQLLASDSGSTKISIPFVSKSLDDVLLFYHEVKIYTDKSCKQNQIGDNLKGKQLSKLSSEKFISEQKSDNEMINLILKQKDQETESCAQTSSQEFIDRICFHQKFTKNHLCNGQGETNLKQKSNFEVNISKENNSKIKNIESNLNTKSKLEEKIPKQNTSRNFLHFPKAVTNISKISSSEYLNHPLEAKKNDLNMIAISETINKSPLTSLLSFFNTRLSTPATPCSGEAAEELSTNSGHRNSSAKESQSKENVFTNAYEKPKKLKSPKILKDKHLSRAQLYSLSEKVAELSEEIGVCKDNVQESQYLTNPAQSNQTFLCTNSNNISSEINEDHVTVNPLNLTPFTDKSNFLNYKNIIGRPTEYCNYRAEITSDNRNQFLHLDIPYCSVNGNHLTDVNERKPVVIPQEEEKERTSPRQSHFYMNINIDSDETDVDIHDEESTKLCNFRVNKQKEDLFYSSFKKQYIPVPKSVHEIKDSSIKSGETCTSNSLPKKSYDALIGSMSLMNNSFLNKYQLKDSQNYRKNFLSEDRIARNDDRLPEMLERRKKDDNETISFIQDFHINLQNSYPERDRISHFTEVMKNKTLQKSFQYGAESLRFELQYLDTIYTRRLEQAKKLTQNSPENYNIERVNLSSSQPVNQSPVIVHEFATDTPDNSFMYASQNTKVNFTEIENDDANKTNSLQQDYSQFRQPIKNCESDTNTKWSNDSHQTNSEFSAILSKEFKRDYIPVRGKRVKLSEANKEMLVVQQVENNDIQGEEKHHIICNVQMSHREDNQEENDEYLNRSKQNDIVVNIFLTRQDPNSSKLSFNINNKIEERLNKHSSKISVCISQDSSDEIQEDEEYDGQELKGFAIEEDKERALAEREFPLNKIPVQNFLPVIKDNTELKLNSEIPECKRALFPRIYSDFSIENKCNPVTYKYLLPNQR